MIPRSTFAARSITTTSSALVDPAEAFDCLHHDPGDLIAALGEALARVIAARPAWHALAACRNTDLDFATTGDTRSALEVCGRCDQMTLCRSWADEIGDVASVLGGENAAARRLRWKQAGIKPPDSLAGPMATSTPKENG